MLGAILFRENALNHEQLRNEGSIAWRGCIFGNLFPAMENTPVRFRVQSSGIRVRSSGFRVQGFRVQALRVEAPLTRYSYSARS